MSERRSLLGDLSWVQVVVGALAAMTSAWIASTLGVGGTIIGAALGSLVIPISSALYGRGLDKGRVLVVRTDRGETVEHRIDDTSSSDTEIIDEAVEARPDVHDAAVVEEPRRLRWRPILLTSVVVLVLAIAAMGVVEVVTDQPYGGNPDNSRIGSPFTGGGGGGSDTDLPQDPAPTGDAPDPDDSVPDEPDPTSTPTPTATPPTDAPSPDVPTPTAQPTAPAE
ncbi:hypothetical protein [Aeromicrobium sp. CF3.5]|uniref:hypothetical protein n=1 Tax=Aeromicrobium sp. CF3.5 TaxID=3373078 RepID=UPI003EE7F82E